jgi:predicted kinase
MTLYILGGLPGSGKTTTCRRLKDQERCFVVSSDALRLALNAGIYPRADDYPKLEPLVWELVRIALTDLIRRGENVAMDATNLSRIDRARWVDLARSVSPAVEVVLLWHTADYDSPERWANERGHTAEEYRTIRAKLLALREEPSESEGFRIVHAGPAKPAAA